MGKKWSESDIEGAVYTRILRRLIKRMDKKTTDRKDAPAQYDFDETIAQMQKIGYCLQIKTNVAQKCDWERRIKYLEDTNEAKQKHEEYATR